MKEFDIVPSLKIKRGAVFYLEGLYKMMREWLDINGLIKNFKEESYGEGTTPRGKDITIDWTTYHDVSSYVRFKIRVTFLITGINKVELQRGHKKIEMDKGNIEIRIDGKVVYDPNDKYKGNFLTFPFTALYEIKMRKRLDAYKLELYKTLYAFHKEVKLYLDMHGF